MLLIVNHLYMIIALIQFYIYTCNDYCCYDIVIWIWINVNYEHNIYTHTPYNSVYIPTYWMWCGKIGRARAFRSWDPGFEPCPRHLSFSKTIYPLLLLSTQVYKWGPVGGDSHFVNDLLEPTERLEGILPREWRWCTQCVHGLHCILWPG